MSFLDALRKGTDIPEPSPAEQPHLASPKSRKELTHNQPLFDYYVVLDFEATCEETIRIRNQEIIEFPSVLLDAHSTTVVSEFQRYVKPVFNPTLTPFCKELTAIKQETVDAAKPFPEVYAEYMDWLVSGGMGNNDPATAKSFCFVTCGDWDLKTMLPLQMSYYKELNAPSFFSRWINIKKLFEAETGVRVKGMPDMLKHFQKPLLGHHHSGIDDCRNITTILTCLLRRGAKPDFTWKPAPGSYTHWCGPSLPPPPASVVVPSSHKVETPETTGTATFDESIAKSNAAAFKNTGAVTIVEGRDPVNDILTAKAGRRIDANETKAISKRLSWALRHGIAELGLTMSSNGYVALVSILSHPRFKKLDEWTVATIVKNNDKQRFALQYGTDGHVYIRANQGHSIQGVEIDMKELQSAADIPCAVHGTYQDAWQFIQKDGLNKMTRQHIHFAKGLPGDKEVISGMRKNCEILVYVDIAKMLADGIKIFESKNGVILTAGVAGVVAPKYFKQVINARNGQVLMEV